MIRKDLEIMNSEIQKIFKKSLVTLLFIVSLGSLFSLNFNASLNRFLNDKKQTNFEINYKVLNDQLQFIKSEKGYIATLDVNFKILRGDKELVNKDFSYLAGALTEAQTKSPNYYTLDKLGVTLTKDDLKAVVSITDRNSKQQATQTFDLKTISKTSLCSDIEISQNIKPDSTTYLQKFHRGDLLFYVDPVPVFTSIQDSLYLYYEAYNIAPNTDSLFKFYEEIKITKGDSCFFVSQNQMQNDAMPCQIFRSIPIRGLLEGLYNIEVTIIDSTSNNTSKAVSSFSISKVHIPTTRIFPDNENEYKLLDYFFTSKDKRMWRKLTEDGKQNFLEKFWKKKDPTPKTEKNEFLEDIQKRIEYANWHWSHFDKGWTSDLGRIYLKYGAADQIIEKQTEVSSKFSKKDYKIWKYNYGSRVYIFMDIYNSGRFRLIYTKNDDTEKSDPEWKMYMGSAWDSSELENTEFNDNSWLGDDSNKTE